MTSTICECAARLAGDDICNFLVVRIADQQPVILKRCILISPEDRHLAGGGHRGTGSIISVLGTMVAILAAKRASAFSFVTCLLKGDAVSAASKPLSC
jgi:hypothetical protein